MTVVTRIAAAVILVGLASPPVAAQSDALREMQDRVQIENLMWQYVRALDTRNAEAYASVYTPDGQFGSGTNAAKGSDALKKMITDLGQRAAADRAKGVNRPSMYHVITNPHIQFVDKDHVRYEAYWMTVFGAVGTETPPRVAAAGREVDEIVRQNGRWLIQMRDVAPKD